MSSTRTPRLALRPTRRQLLGTGIAGLACAWLGSLRGAADEPPQPGAGGQGELDAEQKAFVARVNAAIDKGRDGLLATQRNDGTFVARPRPAGAPANMKFVDVGAYGEQALVLLALAKSGVKVNHPQMKRGLSALSRLTIDAKGIIANNEPLGSYHTYQAACVVLLLDALYVEHPAPDPARPDAPVRPKSKLPGEERAQIKDIVDFFVRTQREALWRYPGPTITDEDQSATQYALLALVTAGRLGVHAAPEVYRKALVRLLAWQQETGPVVPVWAENPAWDPSGRYPRFVKVAATQARGFPYQAKGSITGSMTCAALSSLAIVKDRLSADHLAPAEKLTREEQGRIDRALVDGLAWMGSNFDVKKNPGGTGWHYYYLYGMERACSLMGVPLLAQHDWYREGADHLVGAQQGSGLWPSTGPSGEGRADIQSAFALLFLKRATVPTRFRAPAITGGDEGAGPVDGR